MEFAIDAVLSWSRQVHEIIGDGSILEQDEFLADNAKLISCENDTDYNMVKKMLCNEGREPVGPYHLLPELDCISQETDEDYQSMGDSSEEEED